MITLERAEVLLPLVKDMVFNRMSVNQVTAEIYDAVMALEEAILAAVEEVVAEEAPVEEIVAEEAPVEEVVAEEAPVQAE
jgi:hypothetical protein